MTTAIATLTGKLAQRFGMTSDTELVSTLKQTAFKTSEPVSDAQLTALLVIANEYGLNPWTKEIYAYPDKHKGIVPVVGVDGWIRIVNEHPQFDGIEFNTAEKEWVTCTIYRKDRTRPTVITEYLQECARGTDPWRQMPRRMLRHKALMQCARVAFGFALYDDEEARIAAGETVIDAATGEIIERAKAGAPAPAAQPELPEYPAADFDKNFPAWAKTVASGKKTASEVLATLQTKATFSEEQKAKILSLKVAATDATPAQAPAPEPAPAPATSATDDWTAAYDAAEEGAK